MSRLSLLSLCLLAFTTLSFAAPDGASMNPDSGEKKNSAFGGPLMKDRPKGAKTEITAKKQATFDNAANLAEFEGNVIVQDPQFTLYCDKLKVTLNPNRKGLQLAEATGNVIIVQTNTDESGKVVKSIGRSGKAIYDPTSGNITLTIWPSVQHDVNMQVATEESTVMVLNRNGKSNTTGPSKTSIIDTGDQQQSKL